MSYLNEEKSKAFNSMVSDVQEKLEARLKESNQSYLVKALQNLSMGQNGYGLTKPKKLAFLQQLHSLDLMGTLQKFDAATRRSESSTAADIQPIPSSDTATAYSSKNIEEITEDAELWKEKGLQLLRYCKVGVITLAGGQGTRLGSSLPKGMYDIGLPSHKSLFEIQADRLKGLAALVETSSKPSKSVEIPWYIMTSDPTHTATVAFFKSKDYFGLSESSIRFFKQGHLPSFDFEGKILLEDQDKITSSPDGNGSIYKSLKNNGIWEEMKAKGIEHIHICSVDNVLVKIGDPIFIGYCASKKAQAGMKAVEKEDPNESVGVLGLKEGKYTVLEYSEIGADLAAQRDANGKLSYRYANIVNHYFTLNFLESICEALESSKLVYHIAKKKIPYYDPIKGERITPIEPNGIKLELFLFDVLALLESPLAILQVLREKEFAPLKNPKGADSPDTCREALLRYKEGY